MFKFKIDTLPPNIGPFLAHSPTTGPYMGSSTGGSVGGGELSEHGGLVT